MHYRMVLQNTKKQDHAGAASEPYWPSKFSVMQVCFMRVCICLCLFLFVQVRIPDVKVDATPFHADSELTFPSSDDDDAFSSFSSSGDDDRSSGKTAESSSEELSDHTSFSYTVSDGEYEIPDSAEPLYSNASITVTATLALLFSWFSLYPGISKEAFCNICENV